MTWFYEVRKHLSFTFLQSLNGLYKILCIEGKVLFVEIVELKPIEVWKEIKYNFKVDSSSRNTIRSLHKLILK